MILLNKLQLNVTHLKLNTFAQSQQTYQQAQQVDSLPSVGGGQNHSLMQKSLEDVSAEIVKDTLVKVMSGVHINNENVRANSQCLVDSPSRLTLVQSIKERIENDESEQMIDTPSKMNLDQINECYSKENETNDSESGAPDLVDEHDKKAEPVPKTENVRANSQCLVDSPSRLILVQSKETIENDESEQMNLDQINECYSKSKENETNDDDNESGALALVDEHDNKAELVRPEQIPETDLDLESSPQLPDNSILVEEIQEELPENLILVEEFQGEKALNEEAEEKNLIPEEDNKIIDEKIKEMKNKIQEEKSTSRIMSTKELYSNSSSHLCSKLSETIMKAEKSQEKQPSIHGRESVKSLDLSKHDLRNTVRYLKSFSGYYLIPLYLSYRTFVEAN